MSNVMNRLRLSPKDCCACSSEAVTNNTCCQLGTNHAATAGTITTHVHWAIRLQKLERLTGSDEDCGLFILRSASFAHAKSAIAPPAE